MFAQAGFVALTRPVGIAPLLGGRIPFGYDRKELVPDELTAPAPPRGWQPNIVLWVLSNEAYVGRVHWREQTFPGIHEPLIEQDTFDTSHALLRIAART
jgi:Recombinase